MSTKLSQFQKQSRKDMKAEFPDAQFGYCGRVTVMIVPAGIVNRMTVSIASEDETKIRRKVGEYHCLSRMVCDYSVIVPKNTDAQYMAEVWASYM